MPDTTSLPPVGQDDAPAPEWGPMWWFAWMLRDRWPPAPNGTGAGGQAVTRPTPAPQPQPVSGRQAGDEDGKPAPPCEDLSPSALVSGEALDEARALDALGERREFSRRMEALFVEGLRRLLECEGEAATAQVIQDFAYLLDLSTETVKRYLRKHTGRWAEFEMVGEVVRLREVRRVG